MPTPAGFEALVDKTPLLIKLLESQNAEVRTGTLALMASCLGCAPTLEAVQDSMESGGAQASERLVQCERDQLSALLGMLNVSMGGKAPRPPLLPRATPSKFPFAAHLLAVLVVGGFLAMIFTVLFLPEQPNGNGQLLLGAFTTAFGAVINYYFDSSGMNKTPPQVPDTPK